MSRLWFLSIISMPLVASIHVNQYIADLYQRWNISHSANIEYSIKFSPMGFNADRCVIGIPKPYLDMANEKQLCDLLEFIPDKNIQQLMLRNLKTCDVGSLIYAYERGKGNIQSRYKVYFDFGRDVGLIDSYEWQDNCKQLDRLTYTVYPKYKALLKSMLSSPQMTAFNALRPWLDEPRTLWKKSPSNDALCFRFKPDLKVGTAQKYVTDLVLAITNKSGKNDRIALESVLAKIKDYNLSWLHISLSEISIYYRTQPWIYWPQHK